MCLNFTNESCFNEYFFTRFQNEIQMNHVSMNIIIPKGNNLNPDSLHIYLTDNLKKKGIIHDFCIK